MSARLLALTGFCLVACASCGAGREPQPASTPAPTASAPPPAPSASAPAPSQSAEGPPVDADAGQTAQTDPDAASAAQPDPDPWCPPDVESLPGPICASLPEGVAASSPTTLVIFLHGVTNVGSGWQMAPIRGMAMYAKQYGFAMLAPRGPHRAASEDKDEAWAWHSPAISREQSEATIVEGWMTAKSTLEARMGKKFDRVYVFGFSSGAYYGASLALRGRLPVDGYAVFAGGAAPYSQSMISNVKNRAPIFVGYGLKDKTAVKDARKLVAALRAAHWKHKEMAVPKAGHTMTSSQFAAALSFLSGKRHEPPAAKQPDTKATKQPDRPTKHPAHRHTKSRAKH